jgi:hypothetical protein
MTVNDCGNDTAIEDAGKCCMMGFWFPYCNSFLIIPIALELKAMLIVLPTPIAECAFVRPRILDCFFRHVSSTRGSILGATHIE